MKNADSDRQVIEFKVDDKPIHTKKPVLTGIEILQLAEKPTDAILYQGLENGQLNLISHNTKVELSSQKESLFYTAKPDQTYNFVIDGKQKSSNLPFVTGFQLKEIAGVETMSYGVWLIQIGDDQFIDDTDKIMLSGDGTEKFFTGIDTTTEGSLTSVLPPDDRSYLLSNGIEFEERTDGIEKAVILKGLKLPEKQFDIDTVDILLFFPSAYPDCAPDMFYVNPWVRLASNNCYPRAANERLIYSDHPWQRWSRHNNQWRPGIDGIWTILHRIKNAFRNAE